MISVTLSPRLGCIFKEGFTRGLLHLSCLRDQWLENLCCTLGSYILYIVTVLNQVLARFGARCPSGFISWGNLCVSSRLSTPSSAWCVSLLRGLLLWKALVVPVRMCYLYCRHYGVAACSYFCFVSW